MKRILVVSGSRADYGLLEWPVKVLREDGAFEVEVMKIWGHSVSEAFDQCQWGGVVPPDLILLLGDRYEILAAATAAHLQRIPIAHIGGGDVTEGSYDDAMRDCISRMASIHFVTSTSAMARLSHMGFRNIHLVGNPGIDYIRHAGWKGPRPIAEPYVVVSYQAETIEWDGFFDGYDLNELHKSLPSVGKIVWIMPNPDLGSDGIRAYIEQGRKEPNHIIHDFLPHAEFLNLLAHCEEFIGNSSAMLYEAPELGIKTRMIGKRQRGRTIPWGDGEASNRIVNILKHISI